MPQDEESPVVEAVTRKRLVETIIDPIHTQSVVTRTINRAYICRGFDWHVVHSELPILGCGN
jgi:hypothetical protein